MNFQDKDSVARIARNVAFLYARMLLTLAISLYTVRLILELLGVVDFGIFNVVGGIVLTLEFLKASLGASTQRFLAFELGKKDLTKLRRVFSMGMYVNLLVALVIVTVAETLGLRLLNSYLSIPSERLFAANIVFHAAVFSFVVGIFGLAFTSLVIAEERMKVYLYVSLFETIAKLIAVYLLSELEFDKLISYSILSALIPVFILIFYIVFCVKSFSYARMSLRFDGAVFRELFNFGKWNLFGGLAGVASGHGVNLLLNIFFGPGINAARAVSYQIAGALNLFTSNIQVAINPQIIKSYSSGNIAFMENLVLSGAKFSFFLLLFLCLPVFFETQLLFELWLVDVPEFAILFTKLILIGILIDSLSGSLMTAAQATGDIKYYQMVVGTLLIANLPISYFLLANGSPSYIVFIVSIFISLIALFVRILIISGLVGFSCSVFSRVVLARVFAVAVVSPILPYAFTSYAPSGGWWSVCGMLIAALSVVVSVYLVGLSRDEREFLAQQVTDALRPSPA